MGSPLGPTLANFCLGHIEKRVFGDENIDPDFYARYVDDIFCLFKPHKSIEAFLEILNKQHNNIKFTLEKGTEKLPFLDTVVMIGQSEFEIGVYRKPTHTGVILNYRAVCPKNWKTGLLTGMLHRAKRICSNDLTFMNEVEKLKVMFKNNGYSIKFFDSVLEKCKIVWDNPNNNEKKDIDFEFVLRVPFTGKPAFDFKHKICDMIFQEFKISPCVCFTSTKVGHYFNPKARTPLPLQANVVYKFQCLCDEGMFYIGKTRRHLFVRAQEHLLKEKNSTSAISKHLKCCRASKDVSFEQFSVLKKCKNDFECKISESILIRKLKPKINEILYKSGAIYMLKIFNCF